MSSNEIDNLNETIAQALQQMKAEQGDTFSLKKVNLAELSRRTGISRKRLRNAKKHGFRIPVHGNTGRKKDNGKKTIRFSPATQQSSTSCSVRE